MSHLPTTQAIKSGANRLHSVFDSNPKQGNRAKTVPNFNDPIVEVTKTNPSKNIVPEQVRNSVSRILAPRGAPSTVSSEKFLKSRFSFSPEFIHNEAATKSARISNFYSEAPRFSNDVDFLA
tara:strand:+ start:913 stop:1278 length:366 start_codon:yes stop_codon:yes gene_type:complete